MKNWSFEQKSWVEYGVLILFSKTWHLANLSIFLGRWIWLIRALMACILLASYFWGLALSINGKWRRKETSEASQNDDSVSPSLSPLMIVIMTTLKLGQVWMNDYYLCCGLCRFVLYPILWRRKISLLLAILPSSSHDNWHPLLLQTSISWPIISEITIIQTHCVTKRSLKLQGQLKKL